MKTGTVKLMTLITTAVLGTFSAGTVLAAENNDFYTQPPADSDWEKADSLFRGEQFIYDGGICKRCR